MRHALVKQHKVGSEEVTTLEEVTTTYHRDCFWFPLAFLRIAPTDGAGVWHFAITEGKMQPMSLRVFSCPINPITVYLSNGEIQ